MEKGVLELRRAATIKPKKIECSVLFQLDHNGSLRKVKKFNGMFPTKKQARIIERELRRRIWKHEVIIDFFYRLPHL